MSTKKKTPVKKAVKKTPVKKAVKKTPVKKTAPSASDRELARADVQRIREKSDRLVALAKTGTADVMALRVDTRAFDRAVKDAIEGIGAAAGNIHQIYKNLLPQGSPMNVFPAAPGTMLVVRENNQTEMTPIVGYQHVQGSFAYPICAVSRGNLTAPNAVMTPDGYVSDRAIGRVFDKLGSWEQVADSAGYEKMKLPSLALPAGAVQARMITGGDLRKAGEQGKFLGQMQEALHGDDGEDLIGNIAAGGDTIDGMNLAPGEKVLVQGQSPGSPIPDGVAEVSRIPKKNLPQKFLSASFWSTNDRKNIFTVPGGTLAPPKAASGYEKITNIQFRALKKEGAKVVEPPVFAAPQDREDESGGLI